ncbi:MAG: SMR family transporter [Methylotenera sp.]|nr:SMR family transporter [Methylotenera sp.]
MNHWVALTIAIIAEVIATSTLKMTAEFTKLVPSLVVVVGVGYAVAFYFMTISLRVLPVGIMYAIWAGLGVVLVTVVGWVVYKQVMDLPAILGLILIIAGVVIINLFSSAIRH